MFKKIKKKKVDDLFMIDLKRLEFFMKENFNVELTNDQILEIVDIVSSVFKAIEISDSLKKHEKRKRTLKEFFKKNEKEN